MKKIFAIAMTLLIASSAFAQEEEKKVPDFKYGARAWVYGVTGQQKDLTYDYSHVRIRPMFSLEMEDIKIVTHFEITQNFGRGSEPNYAPSGPAYSGQATDNVAVRVKGAYVEAKKVIIPNLSLMGGLNGYKYPLVIDNDFALFQASYDFGMDKDKANLKANLTYIKLHEYSLYEKQADGSKQNVDAQAYALDVPIKINKDITVRPGVIYIQGGKKFNDANVNNTSGLPETVNLYGTSLINSAINAEGKVNAISFIATGAYLAGTLNKDTTTHAKTKTSAYAFDLGVNFKANNMFKIGAFGTYLSGNDKNADKNNNYFKNMENIFGRTDRADGAGIGRLFILEAATITQTGGDYEKFFAMDHEQGYISYGINAEAKIEKVTLFAQFGMAQTAEKIAYKKNIGSEIDFKVSYELASKTSIFAEFAYILGGDVTLTNGSRSYYQKDENLYQVAFGMTSQI